MSRGLATRLIALAIVVVLGLYYIVFDVLRTRVLSRPYSVSVVLPTAGGIYPDASVTYRGVTVGKVVSLQLRPKSVVAHLAIRNGVKIPANATASVKELTAAAEQYMNLVPAKNDPPFLHNGSVIPENRTSVPISIGQLLGNLNTLVGSLHASNLNTISSSLAQGLRGAGGDLRSIITDSNQLLQALQEAEPATIKLISSGNTVLNTALATSGDFSSFTANLDLLSRQLVQSDADLRALLANGAAASASVGSLLSATSGATASVIGGLSTTTNTAFDRQPAMRALFQILPLFANDVAATASGGNIRFQLLFNDKNTVCPYTSRMVEPTSLVASADLTRNCSTQAPDLLQRGADKAPPPVGG